eukprot:2556581-Rhodomonas_salina.1
MTEEEQRCSSLVQCKTRARESTSKIPGKAKEGGGNLALLLHELADDGLGLTHLSHGEGADLVQAHHVRHGREDEHRVELLAQRLNHFHNLLCELLHEDERADEHVRRLNVALESLQGLRVAELLEQVAD